MQPGNNWKVFATCSEQELNDVEVNPTLQNGLNTENSFRRISDQSVPRIEQQSPLLSLWRHMYVELDSMGAAVGNSLTGTIQGVPLYDGQTNYAELWVEALEGSWEEADHFNRGVIVISGYTGPINIPDPQNPGQFLVSGGFLVAYSWLEFGADKLEIHNAPATIVQAEGAHYTLWDDDIGTLLDQAPGVFLPRYPDTGMMQDVYNRVYVEPLPSCPCQSNSPFVLNVNTGSNSTVKTVANTNRDLTSSAEFWAVHVTSAFQGRPSKDLDPPAEAYADGPSYGITAFFGGTTSSGGSLIFLETIREPGGLDPHYEQFTVVHETGHQFLLEHEYGKYPPNGWLGDYIMTDDPQTFFSPNEFFSPKCSHLIRSISHPQPNPDG